MSYRDRRDRSRSRSPVRRDRDFRDSRDMRDNDSYRRDDRGRGDTNRDRGRDSRDIDRSRDNRDRDDRRDRDRRSRSRSPPRGRDNKVPERETFRSSHLAPLPSTATRPAGTTAKERAQTKAALDQTRKERMELVKKITGGKITIIFYPLSNGYCNFRLYFLLYLPSTINSGSNRRR